MLLSESPGPAMGSWQTFPSASLSIVPSGGPVTQFSSFEKLFFSEKVEDRASSGIVRNRSKEQKGGRLRKRNPFPDFPAIPRNGKEFGYSVFSLMALATSSSFIPLDALIKTKVLANRLAFK